MQTNFNCKAVEVTEFIEKVNSKSYESSMETTKKNIAGQFMTYNLKNFHWANKKLDLELTMS